MGCSSCGKKRANIGTARRINNLTTELANRSHNHKPLNTKNHRASKGVEIIRSKPSKIINELTNTSKKINMMNPSSRGRYIYLVGYKSNCSECQYLKGLLERLGSTKNDHYAQIWALDPKNVNLKGVPFVSLPMVYLVEDGELITYFSGFKKEINSILKNFLFGEEIKKEEESNEILVNTKNKKVVLLDPNPTLTEAYQKFLETMDDTNVDRITTFMDPSTNKLVVTIVYNTP